MAILNDGINGGFRGKVGTVVGYELNGKWVIRKLPKLSKKNKRGTVAQNFQRGKFKKLHLFLDHTFDFIRVGFNLEGKRKGLSAHNAAKSYNLRNAFTPEGEIDYNQVLVASGKLATPLGYTHAGDDIGIHFSWSYDKADAGGHARDQVMLLAYSVKKKKSIKLLSGARRSAEKETLEIPKVFKGVTFHTWIAFISDDRESISESRYVGEIKF